VPHPTAAEAELAEAIADALALIKPAVRAQAAYTLVAPATRIKLNQNEHPLDLPEALKREILERAIREPWNRYPEFAPRHLLEQLAAHYGWDPDGILVGNGSNELIQATLATTLGTGDTLVAPTPTFALYRLMASVLGARYAGVPFAPGFAYDVDAIIRRAQSEQARVIVLNTPNNPTGSALPDGALERLLDETSALLVVDEAYQDFGGPSAIPLLATSPRVVVLRTFSKALGLAGLRFGAALAHPAVAREIAKAKLPYNVNVVTLTAASVLLAHAGRHAEAVAAIVATRERTREQLAGLPGLTVHPSAANFLLLEFADRAPADVFRRLVDDHGILLRDVSGTPELRHCLRLSIGTPDEMDATVRALRAVLGA